MGKLVYQKLIAEKGDYDADAGSCGQSGTLEFDFVRFIRDLRVFVLQSAGTTSC